MQLRKQYLRGRTVQDGGTEVSFGREQLLLWCTAREMFEPFKIEIWDDDVGADDKIGGLDISLFEYAALSVQGEDNVVLRSYMLVDKGKPGGELIAVLECLPCCNLDISCVKGVNLRNPNWIGKTDPYIRFEMESQCKAGSNVIRSST